MPRLPALAALAAALTANAAPGAASTIVYSTQTGATVGGRPVQATAEFRIDPVQKLIEITIQNLQQDPRDVGQLISGLAFQIGGVAAPTATLLSSGGQTVTIGSGKASQLGADIDYTAWQVQPAAANLFPGLQSAGLFLCRVCITGGGPSQLIIGSSGDNQIYDGANGSLTNKAHNYYLLGDGTYAPLFVLSVPQITEKSKIAKATFTFGTSFGSLQEDGFDDTPVPEPGSWLLAATGAALMGLGYWGRRKG